MTPMNDSWKGLQQTYPRLRGQLSIFDDRGVPAPDSPVVTQKPMMDWATPACLLPKLQRKKGIHKHVVWGMFDMAMLAKEWTRGRASAPVSQVLATTRSSTINNFSHAASFSFPTVSSTIGWLTGPLRLPTPHQNLQILHSS
jgi:hypothetical protein